MPSKPVRNKKCLYCDRKFGKAEHLKRHQRSRELEKLARDTSKILTLDQTQAKSHSNVPIVAGSMHEGTEVLFALSSNRTADMDQNSDVLMRHLRNHHTNPTGTNFAASATASLRDEESTSA